MKNMWDIYMYIYTVEYYSVIKRRKSCHVCDNIDGHWEYYAKWNKSEKDKRKRSHLYVESKNKQKLNSYIQRTD